jgi:hypothetical protein
LQLSSLFMALVVALTIHPAKARAQIVGELEATVPFQFYAGNAKLPAGKYIVRRLDNSDPRIMEISSADDSVSALFEVADTEANSAPRKGELVFNQYGDRYFLADVFDEDNADGVTVPASHYETRLKQTAAKAEQHVPTHHRGS